MGWRAAPQRSLACGVGRGFGCSSARLVWRSSTWKPGRRPGVLATPPPLLLACPACPSALQFPKGYRTIQVKSGKAYIRKTPVPDDESPAPKGGDATCGA